MDDSAAHSYIKKLSEELESDEALLHSLPKGIHNRSDEWVIQFLENNPYRLLERSFCFRPKNTMLTRGILYGAHIQLLQCVRRMKGMPHAILFQTVSWVGLSGDSFYPEKSFDITICIFHLLNTIGKNENYGILAGSPRLNGCHEIFHARYQKTLYGKFIQPVVNILPHSKSWHDRQKIFTQLEKLETAIAWMADQKITTFLKD